MIKPIIGKTPPKHLESPIQRLRTSGHGKGAVCSFLLEDPIIQRTGTWNMGTTPHPGVLSCTRQLSPGPTSVTSEAGPCTYLPVLPHQDSHSRHPNGKENKTGAQRKAMSACREGRRRGRGQGTTARSGGGSGGLDRVGGKQQIETRISQRLRAYPSSHSLRERTRSRWCRPKGARFACA